MDFFRFWIVRNSRTTFSIQTLLFFSIFVGITRGMLEQLFFGIEVNGSDILGFIPFYFSLPFFYATLISFIPGIRYEQVLQPVTFATLLGILPPVFDFIFGSTKTHNVFYGYYLSHDYANFPWLGLSPARNYPLGEAVTIWLTFIFAAFFVYNRKRSVLYAIFGIAVAYLGFLIYSLVLPGVTSFLLFGMVENPAILEHQSTAQLRQSLFFLSVVQVLTAWFMDAGRNGMLARYAKRLLHFLPFLMVTVLGAIVSGADLRGISIAIIVTFCSGIAVIAQNDFLALAKNDQIHGRAVGLSNVTAVMVYALLLFGGYKIALLGFACFSLSALYHYDFFNIRATLLGSMKVEGMWGFLTFLSGVFAGSIAHPNRKIISMGVLIFGGFSLFSILKDAKDLRADYREGRKTIYTLLFRRKIRIRKVQRVVAGVVGALLCGAGAAYYVFFNRAFLIHLILCILTTPVVLHVHKRRYFQLFMLLVCALFGNLIFYEYGHQ